VGQRVILETITEEEAVVTIRVIMGSRVEQPILVGTQSTSISNIRINGKAIMVMLLLRE